MGVQAQPQPDHCRLIACLRDGHGYKEEICQNLRYLVVGAGRSSVSLRVVQVMAAPDLSIPRHHFNAVTREKLPWPGNSVVFELDEKHQKLVEKVQQLLLASPLAPYYALVEARCVCLNIFRALDPPRRNEFHISTDGKQLEEFSWPDYHTELQQRISGIMQSAAWTYFPMKVDRVDCTAIMAAAISPGCDASLSAWLKELQQVAGLRNGATRREMLELKFAFQVFPLEGEKIAQIRRDVVRQLSAVVEKEWGAMDFRCPQLACWVTHSEYLLYDAYMEEREQATGDA
mmetsp:Transcript_40852/g.91666  ORF Transcript_40852/g.91666 Transcript_40852/m.91666 type:complete len:288 (+) Transcript_40852:3-866(+)